jgi:hypothetical protein
VAEELRPTTSFGLRADNENIWHIGAAERWSDGQLIGHRTYCGRNYPRAVQRGDLAELAEVCSDCSAQVARRH